MNEWINERTNGWMDEWINGLNEQNTTIRNLSQKETVSVQLIHKEIQAFLII